MRTILFTSKVPFTKGKRFYFFKSTIFNQSPKSPNAFLEDTIGTTLFNKDGLNYKYLFINNIPVTVYESEPFMKDRVEYITYNIGYISSILDAPKRFFELDKIDLPIDVDFDPSRLTKFYKSLKITHKLNYVKPVAKETIFGGIPESLLGQSIETVSDKLKNTIEPILPETKESVNTSKIYPADEREAVGRDILEKAKEIIVEDYKDIKCEVKEDEKTVMEALGIKTRPFIVTLTPTIEDDIINIPLSK